MVDKGKVRYGSWVFFIFGYIGNPLIIPGFFKQEAFGSFKFLLFGEGFTSGNYLLFFHILFFIVIIMCEDPEIFYHGIVKVGEGATRAFVAVENILFDNLVKGRYIFSID